MQFGHVIQCVLTEVPYSEIGGVSNIEWDVIRLMPEFMNLWLLNDYKTIADCSEHIVTKQKIPEALQKAIRDGKHLLISYLS